MPPARARRNRPRDALVGLCPLPFEVALTCAAVARYAAAPALRHTSTVVVVEQPTPPREANHCAGEPSMEPWDRSPVLGVLMDTDDVLALSVGAVLVILLVLIGFRTYRHGSPGAGLLVSLAVALMVAFLLLGEEAL